MTLQISYAQSVITPALGRPVFLAGFGQNRRAQTIHDPLYARALALHENHQTLVLCALDLIGLFHPDVQDVIREVHEINPDTQVIIASTHTHHGPDTMGLWGPDDRTSGVDPTYLSWLKTQLVETILAAASSSAPSVARWKAVGVAVPGIAKNARNPEIVDDELAALQFLTVDGHVLATLVDFPCHPEVLWETNPHITADYPGVLRREIEAVTRAPCIFFSGALGGMMTPDVQQHSFAEAEQMGKTLATAALGALAGVEARPAPHIKRSRQEIAIRLTNILFKVAFWRKLLPDVRNRHGEVISEVNLVQIGDAWFATMPGELLPKLGLELKADMKRAGARLAAVISLANDELGYILPAEEFKYPWNPLKPGKHYEETMSLGKQAGPQVVAGMKRLL